MMYLHGWVSESLHAVFFWRDSRLTTSVVYLNVRRI